MFQVPARSAREIPSTAAVVSAASSVASSVASSAHPRRSKAANTGMRRCMVQSIGFSGTVWGFSWPGALYYTGSLAMSTEIAIRGLLHGGCPRRAAAVERLAGTRWRRSQGDALLDHLTGRETTW